MLIKILSKFNPVRQLDKIVTWFFVIFFGAIWVFTARYYMKPKEHVIVIYDILGNRISLGIKTNFTRKDVALSFKKEYEKRFPQYNFDFESYIPEIKRRTVFRRIIN